MAARQVLDLTLHVDDDPANVVACARYLLQQLKPSQRAILGQLAAEFLAQLEAEQAGRRILVVNTDNPAELLAVSKALKAPGLPGTRE